MNIIKRLLIISIGCTLLHTMSTYAITLLRPADTLLRPPYDRHLRYHTHVFLETDFGFKSFNSHGSVNSPLHIWQTTQNGLAMLKGFAPHCPASILSNQID